MSRLDTLRAQRDALDQRTDDLHAELAELDEKEQKNRREALAVKAKIPMHAPSQIATEARVHMAAGSFTKNQPLIERRREIEDELGTLEQDREHLSPQLAEAEHEEREKQRVKAARQAERLRKEILDAAQDGARELVRLLATFDRLRTGSLALEQLREAYVSRNTPGSVSGPFASPIEPFPINAGAWLSLLYEIATNPDLRPAFDYTGNLSELLPDLSHIPRDSVSLTGVQAYQTPGR